MSKEDLKTCLYFLLAGVLIAAGARAAEHLIPAPEMRVVFCLVEIDGRVEDCKPLAEWLDDQEGEA